MAGVPYHSAQQYIDVLIEQGYKVAIAEQMEDPKQAVGVVKREVVQVITPSPYKLSQIDCHHGLWQPRSCSDYPAYYYRQLSLA